MSFYKGYSVALALGGGGARGLAHISVLAALDEIGVRPRAISGTSIGAIMGAAYAAGYSGADLRTHVETLFARRFQLARKLLQSRARRRVRLPFSIAHPVLIDGERFLEAFWPPDMPRTFEALQTPLFIVATDFRGRREAVFSSGSLRSAVAGSMAIPGLVRPPASEQGFLVDGGLVNPLPYNHLVGLANIVVAVDVSGTAGVEARGGPPSPLETLIVTSQIMMSAMSARAIADNPPDVLISPAVNQFMALDLFKAERIFAAGDACREELIAGLDRAVARLDRTG